jgi:hypothetical protein
MLGIVFSSGAIGDSRHAKDILDLIGLKDEFNLLLKAIHAKHLLNQSMPIFSVLYPTLSNRAEIVKQAAVVVAGLPENEGWGAVIMNCSQVTRSDYALC